MTPAEVQMVRSTVAAMCRAPEFTRVRRLVQAKANVGENPSPMVEAIVAEIGKTLGECARPDTQIISSFVR